MLLAAETYPIRIVHCWSSASDKTFCRMKLIVVAISFSLHKVRCGGRNLLVHNMPQLRVSMSWSVCVTIISYYMQTKLPEESYTASVSTRHMNVCRCLLS